MGTDAEVYRDRVPVGDSRSPKATFYKLFRAFALRRAGLVSESKNKLQYT